MVKFADVTYLMVPAGNVDSRSTELNNVEAWAHMNNLTLNRSKTREIIFIDPRRKREYKSPLPLPGVVRETSITILGVTITDR